VDAVSGGEMSEYDDWLEDIDEGEDYDEYDPSENDLCAHCGPSCEHWGGDGLCMLQIEQQANEAQEYEEEFVHQNVHCPECGVKLTMYDIPVNELWLWPGDFYNPMIALNIYAVYDAPKGELHRKLDICHIWVGEGEGREEKLIRLTGGQAA
jgi:hypothetical protein